MSVEDSPRFFEAQNFTKSDLMDTKAEDMKTLKDIGKSIVAMVALTVVFIVSANVFF